MGAALAAPMPNGRGRRWPMRCAKISLRLGSLLRSFVRVAIAPRDRTDAAADVVVDVVREVGERDAQGPVRRIEAAAVQQHDAVLLGQAEREIQRMDVLLEVLDRFVAEVLAGPELEVDQTVVRVVELARRRV